MEVYNLRSQRLHIQRNVRRLSLLFMRFEFNPNLESWVEANMCLPIFVNNNIGRTQNNLAHLNSHLWYFWGSMDFSQYCFIAWIQFASTEFHSFLTQKRLVIRCIIMQVMVSAFWSCFFLCLTYFYYSLCVLRPVYSSSERFGAVKLALAQELFRLISFRCSVSLFPLLVSMFDFSNIWLNVGLFVTSESLKIYSLVFWMIKREKPLSWMTLYHRCRTSYLHRIS